MIALIAALITAVQIGAPSPLYEPGADCPTGYEKGVSAMFAGAVGDTLIMAGGANFPDVPVSEGGRKRFYYEIFTRNNDYSPWTYNGMLPESTAYGMSVPLPDGLLCMGGTGFNGQSRQVFKLHTDGSIDRPWPELPAAISEGAAAIADGKVYVAGGMSDGRPSATVWMLDLDTAGATWTPVAPLPSPVMQPVMASSGGRLYLWYGFNTSPIEVSGQGFCYDPSTDQWSHIAPHPTDGTFTGAVAATLPDGRIICTGGVDREIFTEALGYTGEKVREYQRRPQAAYKFQQTLWVYDPATDAWHDAGSDAFSLARAGAGIAITTKGVAVIEGEIKPGIRTPQIAIIPFDSIH